MSDEEHAKFDPWIVEQLTADLAQARAVAHEQHEEIQALNKTQMNLHHVLDKYTAGVGALRDQLAQARADLADARRVARLWYRRAQEQPVEVEITGMEMVKALQAERQRRVEAKAEAARLGTALADACAERDMSVREAEMRTAQLAQARAELADADAAMDAVQALWRSPAEAKRQDANRDYWYTKTQETEAERDEMRKKAQEQSEEMQMHWLSPAQKAGLEWQLEKKYTRQFGIAQEQAWRLAALDRAEAALAGCGIAGIYDTFDGLPDAIEQMSSHISELGEQLEAERALMPEVERELKRELKQRQRQIDLLSNAEKAEYQSRRQAERRAEALVANTREAIDWLWGFYDGNTLIAKPGYEDDIQVAWGRLLVATDDEAAKKLLDRLEKAEALAALVTPELANLLVLLASSADTSVQYHRCTATAEDTKNARAHAARIREALEADND